MTYPTVALGYRIEVAPTADPADPAAGPWTDVTTDLASGVGITHKTGVDDEQPDSFSETTLTLKNGARRWSTDNPLSDMWPGWGPDCPIRCSLSIDGGANWTEWWTQYASEIVDTWAGTGAQMPRTEVKAAGILRRLSQGDQLRSPLYRTMSGVAAGDYVPYQYWPMEDGPDATVFASGLAGGAPLTWSGAVTPAADSSLPGAFALPTVASGAVLRATVPTYTDTGKWVLQTVFYLAGTSTVYDVTTDGAGRRITARFNFGTGNVEIAIYDSAGAATYSSTFPFGTSTPPLNRWMSVTLSMRTTPSQQWDLTYQVLGDPVIYSLGDVMPGKYGRIVAYSLLPAVTGTAVVGHSGLYIDSAFQVNIDDFYNARAMSAWDGEMAHERVERTLRELRIPSDVTATVSTRMGPQQPGRAVDVLWACQDADHGILDDSRGAVTYRALSQIVNQDPVMVIDAAGRELAFPSRPVTDDQRLVNKSTVTRLTGGSGTVDRSDGAAARVRDEELQLYTDDQPIQHASWYVNLGSVRGKRVPAVAVDLLGAPQLAADVLALRVGDRVRVVNCPLTISASGELDLIFAGWTTSTSSRRRWRLTAVCVPYEPYRVAVYGTDPGGTVSRYDTTASTLAAGYSAVATSLSVATAAGAALWVTSAAKPTRFPMQVEIAGMVYICTAISGASSPQTFTIVRLATDKSLPAGSTVRPYQPARYALGSG